MDTAAITDLRACDAALERAFTILGKRWNGMILGTLATGPASFSTLRRAVTGVGDSMLSERLGELARAQLVTRVVDEGPPVAVTYELTEQGRALVPALDLLIEWANTNLAPR